MTTNNNAAMAQALVLLPNRIDVSSIKSGTTIPEVDTSAGEVAWSSSKAYTGVENNINHGGRLWASIAPSTNVVPGTNTAVWRTSGPSNRMAPFDDKITTRATRTGELVYVLQPPAIFNGLALYGLQGDTLQITHKTAPGGDVLMDWSGELYEQPFGLFEYLFFPQTPLTQKAFSDLHLAHGGELTIRITSAGDAPSALGMAALGMWVSLLGNTQAPVQGVEYGASAQIKTYSYIKTEEDGSTTIVPRASATNVECSAYLGSNQANYSADVLRRIAAQPVAVVISGIAQYEYLNTFGLVSGSIEAATLPLARLSLSVKGFI